MEKNQIINQIILGILIFAVVIISTNAGIIRIQYDDLTLGNHTICLFQKVANRSNLIECFSSGETYVTDSNSQIEILDNASYVLKVEELKSDMLSSPSLLEMALFRNLGYIISILLITTITIILIKKLK